MEYIHQNYVIKRSIERNGQCGEVYRKTTNEFGEPKENEKICNIKGLFHESNGYLGVVLAEKGRVYADKKPLFLIVYTEILKKGDLIVIDGRTFEITELDDLGNLHLFIDLSLEVK